MLLEDILTIIAAHGTKGTDLLMGSLPEKPVNAVAVRQYGGADAIFTLGAGSAGTPAMERPRFQVLVRNTSQLAAWTKARAIRALLRWYDGTPAGGVAFRNIVQVGDLGEIATDGNVAHTVVGSFEAQRDPD